MTLFLTGKVNGQWRSMTAFFEMASYAAAVALPGMCLSYPRRILGAVLPMHRVNTVLVVILSPDLL